MKKAILYSICFIIFNVNAVAQDIALPPQQFNVNVPAQSISPPPLTNLLKYIINKSDNEEVKYSFSHARIWGWSKDGKVAYSIDMEIDGRGGCITTAVILNLIDDTVIWQNSIDIWQNSPDKIDEDALYDDFYRDYVDICVKNGIEFVQMEFMDFPIRYNQQIYNVIVDIVEEDHESEAYREAFDTVKSYRIIVETQGKSKIVQKRDDVLAVHIFPLGYFISPYESRALLVMGKQFRGFEGYDIEYIFMGCHLRSGFN